MSIASRAYPIITISLGNNFFRHNAKRVGKVFFVARLPSAPKRTIDENCGCVISGGAGLGRRESSFQFFDPFS